MTDKPNIQAIEEEIARASAMLMASIVQIARVTTAGDADAERLLANLQNCRVVITAVGPQLHVEARVNVAESQYRIWGGSFSEEAAH